jgi:hypothetical protein
MLPSPAAIGSSPKACPPGGIRIARADVADFMLRLATTDDHLNCAPAIAY